MSDAPTIGHNRPPGLLIEVDLELLRQEMQQRLAMLTARRDELLAGVARFHASVEAIGDDDIQGKAAEFVKQLKACSNAIEAAREAEKKPALDAGRTIDAVAKAAMQPLQPAQASIEAKMTAYAVAKERAARAAAAAEAERLRKIAEAQEGAALAEQASMHEAIAASARADDAAALAKARPSELSRVHTDFGGTASLRASLAYQVIDLDAVPRKFLMIDDDAVKLVGKRWKESDPQPIPGIEFSMKRKVAVR